MTEMDLCTDIELDSDFVERRIFRMESDTLGPESCATIGKWCESNQPRYYRWYR